MKKLKIALLIVLGPLENCGNRCANGKLFGSDSFLMTLIKFLNFYPILLTHFPKACLWIILKIFITFPNRNTKA